MSAQVNFWKSNTDVGDDLLDVLPDQFSLIQNYPNPFNPTTVIAFNLPVRSEASIEIINILGQTVDILELGELSSGLHQYEYDASELSGGVYLYRIKAGEFTDSKKMMLLK